jgi:hypothetical protein
MAEYFAGKFGSFQITDIAENIFPIMNWTYDNNRSNVDITNMRSKYTFNELGGESFIKNLVQGTITAQGQMTKELLTFLLLGTLDAGTEAVFNLYFKYTEDDKFGFEELDAVIDKFEYNMDIQSSGTFTITANLAVPLE